MSSFRTRRGRSLRKALYDAIRDYKATHNGKSPTRRELQQITGRSSGAITNALTQLAAQNLISLAYSEPRGIELVGERYMYQEPEPVEIA